MPGVKGGCVEGLLSLPFIISMNFLWLENLDRLMMNATTKLGVLCRMQPIRPSITHIKLAWVKEQNSLLSRIYLCPYTVDICVVHLHPIHKAGFFLEICFPSVIQPIILGLNTRGLGNTIKSYRGYDLHIRIGAQLNIIKQCVFVHVGPKNLTGGCRS